MSLSREVKLGPPLLFYQSDLFRPKIFCISVTRGFSIVELCNYFNIFLNPTVQKLLDTKIQEFSAQKILYPNIFFSFLASVPHRKGRFTFPYNNCTEQIFVLKSYTDVIQVLAPENDCVRFASQKTHALLLRTVLNKFFL